MVFIVYLEPSVAQGFHDEFYQLVFEEEEDL